MQQGKPQRWQKNELWDKDDAKRRRQKEHVQEGKILMRRYLVCLLGAIGAFIFGSLPTSAAPAVLTWGVDKAVTPATVCLYYISSSCFSIGAMSATGVWNPSGQAASFISLAMNANPSLAASLVGNTTPVNTTIVSNGTTAATALSETQAVFGLTSNKGTGQSTLNSNKFTLYSGMSCLTGSRQCWAFNPLTELLGPLSVDFLSANTEEIDFNNSSGTDFNFTYGAVPSASQRFVGATLITGVGTTNVAYAIGVGGLNTTTNLGMFNRGVHFQNARGARLADFQSDDAAQAVLADFGVHTNALDLAGTYSGAVIKIGASGAGGTTPTHVLFDTSFSTTPGAGPKLVLFGSQASGFGFGVSSGQLDYIVPSGSQHRFFVAGVNAGTIAAAGWTNPNSYTAKQLLASTANPTISSGFGTAAAVTVNNGSWAFRIDVGTGGTASSGVIGLPTATTGWNCFATDITTASATVFYTKQTASSTTTATIGNFDAAGAAAAWVANDILAVNCAAL